MTLVIMAAGMGSRFGGLKQVEPVGPKGEFIIDYSIKDAIKNGFTKVVFIIKEENYEIFKETVGKRFEDLIEVKYVFQKVENVPKFVNIPKTRIKPWGTAHAVLSAKKEVTDNFIVINADDFYGPEAFKKASEFLKTADGNNYAFVGYKLKNTVTDNGSVSRGVCQVNDKILHSIIETTKIVKKDDKIYDIDTNKQFDGEEIVSMNFFAFTKTLFSFIEEKIDEFFKDNLNNTEKCEFYLPILIEELIKENKIQVSSLTTSDKWYGVTYMEDKQGIVGALKEMTEKGIY